MEEGDMYIYTYSAKNSMMIFSLSIAKREVNARIWNDKFLSPNHKYNNSKPNFHKLSLHKVSKASQN